MAQKGVNTLIVEARKSLTNTINDIIKEGIPLSVVSMILESSLIEVQQGLNNQLKDEETRYQQELQTEANQVEYVDPEVVDAIDGV